MALAPPPLRNALTDPRAFFLSLPWVQWLTALVRAVDGLGDRTRTGDGPPEGAVAAPVGTLYLRTDGGTGSTLYVKESGTGNTGWAAK